MTKLIKCPYCNGEILDGAKKCKHCKQWLIEEQVDFKKLGKIKLALSYGWTILISLITIIVSLAIVDSVYGDSEKIVVSLLIIIYVNILSFSSAWGFSKTQEILGIYDEFKRIRVLLNDADEYEDSQTEEFRNSQKMKQHKFYINSISNFIIYLIAIFGILSAI